MKILQELVRFNRLDDEEDTEAIRKKALEKLAKVKKEEEDKMADTSKRPRRGLAKPKK